MDKPNFTPGPWRVDVGGFSSCADWAQTFSVKGPPSDFMYLERIEDARLISAAPDLYEAGEEALAALYGAREVCGDIGNIGHAISLLEAALARARGEVRS